MTVTIDATYRKARRNIKAPEWVMPFILVRPTESRRLLEAAFRDDSLSLVEVSAIRGFLRVLVQAESAGAPYPTWNAFVDEETQRWQRDEEDFFADATTIKALSDWRGAFSKTLRHNPTDNERFSNFMDEINARYEGGN